MKICILSMQRVSNFGSLLQGYALKKLLEQSGHRVSFLDICPNEEDDRLLGRRSDPFIDEAESGGSFRSKLKKLDRYAVNRIRIKLRDLAQEAKFRKFCRQELEMDGNAAEEHYDGCVIGSDEVFNCLSGAPWGFTSQLFGNVPQADRVITYGASCGGTVLKDVPEAVRQKIRQSFADVAALSVRDANTYDFVSHLTDKPVQEHPDPALVYDFRDLMDAATLPALLPQRYCVVYSYYNRIHDEADIRRIKAFCQKHDMKILSLGGPQMWIPDHRVLHPFRMLKVFENAAFVITDTFHGTIFAAKYVKKFAVLVRRSNANKLEDLIGKLGLEDHRIGSTEELGRAFRCDNDLARIEALRQAYLRDTRLYLDENL